VSIELRVVDTSDEVACNALTNTAMNAVNERMDYVATERLLELQKVLD